MLGGGKRPTVRERVRGLQNGAKTSQRTRVEDQDVCAGGYPFEDFNVIEVEHEAVQRKVIESWKSLWEL
jgi:hypothetical protein